MTGVPAGKRPRRSGMKMKWNKIRGRRGFNKRRRTNMVRPMTYKFAAPTQRATLYWTSFIGSCSSQATSTSASSYPTNLSTNLVDWSGNQPDANAPGVRWAGWGFHGNSPWDPAGDGKINTGLSAQSAIFSITKQALAHSEWMKLYRKCYTTGSKISFSMHGATSGSSTGILQPSWLGVTFHLAPTDLDTSTNQFSTMFPGAPWETKGNKNCKYRWRMGALSPMPLTMTTTEGTSAAHAYVVAREAKRWWNCGLSMYKSTKAVFGMKTIFGEESLSSTADADPVKRWAWNLFVVPGNSTSLSGDTGDYFKCIGRVDIRFNCSFASRRQVAQQTGA